MSAQSDERRPGDASLRSAFGFDLKDDAWLERLRLAVAEPRSSGDRLGEYELVAAVGRGAQGVVYRARQPHTGRTVALKRLGAGVFATSEMRERFAREVEASAILDHPYIVTVHGCEIIDGQPVLVMHWFDGVPLDEWAAGSGAHGRRTVRDVLRVIERVASAVQHAHQRGVIHRDIKPSNVLVDVEGRPCVLDFGLARLPESPEREALLTRSGLFIGTLAYAAPEQLSGDRRDVDVRSDVYALGVMLYQALVGRLPIDVHREMARVIAAIQNDEIRPPSAFDDRLDREVDAIVLKALAKDKEQRYSSVEAFGDDLRRYLDGQAVRAHPPSTRYRVGKVVRKHKLAVATTGAFVALLLTATAVSTKLYVSAEHERARAEIALESEKRALAEALRTGAVSQRETVKGGAAAVMLSSLIDKSTRGARDGVAVVTLREALEFLTREIEEARSPIAPESEAWMRMSLGAGYMGLGLPLRAQTHFARALALRLQLFGDDNLDVAESLEKLGRCARVLGENDEAERRLTDALAVRRKLLGDADPYFAVNTNSLGILKRHQHKLDEAEALLVESLARYLAYPNGANSVPIVLKNLGLVYIDQGCFEAAVDILEEAFRLALSVYGRPNLDVAQIETDLAAAWQCVGRHAEAEDALRRALSALTELHGDGHPLLAPTQERLADVLHGLQRPAEAFAMIEQALASFRASGNARNIARCLTARARYARHANRVREAEDSLREALCIVGEVATASSRGLAEQRATLAELLLDEGQFDEAEALIDLAAPILSAQADLEPRARLLRMRTALSAARIQVPKLDATADR